LGDVQADAGAALVLADLATSKLVAVGEKLVEQGHRVLTQAVDLVSENSVEELVSFAQKNFGRLDAVVNVAAATNPDESRSWGDGHGGRRLGSNVRG
jgi:NAD(P)-dependent dehydrogenase (short-subunit alcohol dehydrogenase family)